MQRYSIYILWRRLERQSIDPITEICHGPLLVCWVDTGIILIAIAVMLFSIHLFYVVQYVRVLYTDIDTFNGGEFLYLYLSVRWHKSRTNVSTRLVFRWSLLKCVAISRTINFMRLSQL